MGSYRASFLRGLNCSIQGEAVRKLDTLLDECYDARGWDREGVPTPEKLEQLGLVR